MNPHDVHAYLKSFIDFEQKLPSLPRTAFKIERMYKLLEAIGNPQQKLKIIHVAGSKGKGSVCAMTASILEKAGYKVGLYTSPHLQHYRERIRILNGPKNNRTDIFDDAITDEELALVLESIKDVVERIKNDKVLGSVTFYELFTAIALYHFARAQVDLVVLETGLGGRLDATNAAPSIICAITPIGLEHTAVLGDTVSLIAQEKVAIIKDSKQRVVVAKQTDDALKIIHERCRQLGIMYQYVTLDAQTYVESRDLHNQVVHIQSCGNRYREVTMSLTGEHQLLNAKTAVAIVEALKPLGHNIPVAAIHEGLNKVFWPGRFEVIDEAPLMIIDGAHTKESMEYFVNTFVEQFPRKKATLILGVSQDKNIAAICKVLNRMSGIVIATQARHPRAHVWTHDELEKCFPGKETFLAKDVPTALERAKSIISSDGIIVATGSIFLIGEVRECISLRV